jgi:hypothetical protein
MVFCWLSADPIDSLHPQTSDLTVFLQSPLTALVDDYDTLENTVIKPFQARGYIVTC